MVSLFINGVSQKLLIVPEVPTLLTRKYYQADREKIILPKKSKDEKRFFSPAVLQATVRKH